MSPSMMLDPSSDRKVSLQVSIQALPKERSSKTARPLFSVACGCCCSCCCCLHSVGSLVGSLTVPGDFIQDDHRAPRSLLPHIDVRQRYWKVTLVISFLVVVTELLLTGLPFILMTLPIVQLLSSLIVLVTLQNLPKEERPRARWQLRRLTLRGFLGAVLGVAVLAIVLWVVQTYFSGFSQI